jgi:hypothetical protein
MVQASLAPIGATKPIDNAITTTPPVVVVGLPPKADAEQMATSMDVTKTDRARWASDTRMTTITATIVQAAEIGRRIQRTRHV